MKKLVLLILTTLIITSTTVSNAHRPHRVCWWEHGVKYCRIVHHPHHWRHHHHPYRHHRHHHRDWR